MASASDYTWAHGGVVRGPRSAKRLALVFTGGDFGEGTTTVLDTLAAHRVPGSFYFTGDYLKHDAHRAAVARMIAEGHIVGPHSHAHPLYCPWEDRQQTLVTREQFADDLARNVAELAALGVPPESMRWWIPPYEWYNAEIARWSREAGHRLLNFTPGTLSNADYTEDAAPNYRSNAVIWKSIVDFEAEKPDGLNGFLMLVHVGAGPRRTEKFFDCLGDLISYLHSRGYAFTTVPDLLKDAPEQPVG